MEKVVFLGGKNIGHGILEHLVNNDDVLMVYSNPSDRDPAPWHLSVKPITDKMRIPYSTESVNKHVEWFRKSDADFIVCAYYDTIVSDPVIACAKKGCINVHMGLAEEYRGCYPTTFPIINGKKEAGVTIHQLTRDIDAGDIFAQARVTVSPRETGKTLYDKCTKAAVDLFISTWDDIKAGRCPKRKQVPAPDMVYHRRTDFPSHEIDIRWEADKIDRYVRALTFPPFPSPYFTFGGNRFNIIPDERMPP